jgi:CBS domain-containing protein
MLVSELMHEGVIAADVTDTIRAVARIMKENDIGSLPVIENGMAVGFVTDRDMVLAMADDECNLDDEIAVAMSPEVISITPDQDVTEAARMMEENQISRLLVMEGKKPCGIVTLQDLTINVDNKHLKAEVIEEIKH